MLNDNETVITPTDAPTAPAPTQESIVSQGIRGLDRVLNDFAPASYFNTSASA
jgi:hypothetical protein